MKIRSIILIVFIITVFTSCGSSNQEQPDPVTFNSVFDSKYSPFKIFGLTLHHKTISIEGYFSLMTTAALRSESINLLLFEKSDSMGRSISVNMQFGYNQNQVEKLPRYYTKDDLKVHTNDNEIIGANDKVKVTGKRYCHKGQDACYIIAEIVEKAQ